MGLEGAEEEASGGSASGSASASASGSGSGSGSGTLDASRSGVARAVLENVSIDPGIVVAHIYNNKINAVIRIEMKQNETRRDETK